ncbi:5'-methylthioadenosine/S-adenosylhomocysteine nucleosidase [Paracoccus alkenifer]|nr:5'-methylthioadenosine/S-adenosylhomocysteine nucleosidase [Paracoccus alkenifer]
MSNDAGEAFGGLRSPRIGAGLPVVDRIAGRRLLFTMAAPEEYGPALRALISPVMTGIGPVEAAISVTAALTRLEAARALPEAVVCLGSAGSRHLEQGGVYQARSVGWRDMDVSALGFARGLTPGLDLPAELALGLQIPGIPSASLSSGAAIVSGADYDTIDADMVDMETHAVCRACLGFAVPMIGLRGISDGAEPLTGFMDWTRYLAEIDRRLAAALELLAVAVGEGLLD